MFTYFATKRNSDESKIRYVYVRQFHNELCLFLKLLSTVFVLKFLEYQEWKTSFSQVSRQAISDVTLHTKPPEKNNKEFGCHIHLTRSTEIFLYIYILQYF